MITSKYTIREKNEATILQIVIENKEISRFSLSTITNLNKATVSSIVKKLLDDDLIIETRIGDSSKVGGRKPILLKFNPHSSLVIAFDIGIDFIEGCLTYVDGTFIHSLKQTNIEIDHKTIAQTLIRFIDQLREYAPKTKHGIIGLTVAVHGIVHNNEILYTPNYSHVC